jgi:hypothetical protein
MPSSIQITLGVDAFAKERLDRLRLEFMQACNWLVPFVVAHHCWNRVALHHLTYHQLRASFPHLGSQMACNAIYSVCRSYRLLLTHSQSPFFGKSLKEGQLPQIQFLESSPVFFDRHTLSLQRNMLSLYTLEGRMRFAATLSEEDIAVFCEQKLREVQLMCNAAGVYQIHLTFSGDQGATNQVSESQGNDSVWPSYLVFMDDVNSHELSGFVDRRTGSSFDQSKSVATS